MKKISCFILALALFGCSGSTVAQQPPGRAVDRTPTAGPASGVWAQTPRPTAAAPAAPAEQPAANQGIARMTPKPTSAAPATAAATMYVKSANTLVRQSTALSSATVTKLQIGDQVSVTEKGALQWKVRTASGVVGYVSKLNLSETPPKTSGGRSPIVIASSGPNERDSVNAQRGLTATTQQAAKESNLPEEAITDATKMEESAAKITNADIDAFLAEGKVFAQ
ncbi:SH3 domain-containing protein [Candidatus Sumerlaeota bacterium]|nr:SH3 domain-containing protein [Candidatus Sumerlaeota bacterium]